jgi:ATP-dependent metalloprotease
MESFNGSGNKRGIFSLTKRSNVKRLKSYERDANSHPDDPYYQLRFLQELNKNYPALVIRRVEENRFATSGDVQKEYLKALVR